MRIAILTFVITALATVPALSAVSKQLTLCSNGKSKYTIVLGKNASPSEKHAASELQRFLKEISGAQLPIVTGKQASGPKILIGCDALSSSWLRNDLKKLGDEGFHIKMTGSDLIIAGGRQRGTMYGVYAFLEETLGCRWYSSKVSKIPKKMKIVVGPLNITQKPAFEYREPFYTDAFNADWAARNRCNSSHASLDSTRGGKIAFGKGAFVHTFYTLVPPADYSKDHPEYYSLVNGQRTWNGAQLCLTNPDVLSIVTAKVMQWIKEDPEAVLFSVSQNDCGGPCQCANCQKVVAEEGSEAGPMIRFANAVAAEVGKKHPDKLIETLAYQYTRNPPKTAPVANVRVRLCPIENCVVHPFEQCPNDKTYIDVLRQWSKLTSNLYVWHYNTNFGHYLLPFPNYDELAADVPMYKRNGVKGLFMQGNYSPGGGGEFAELRAYVLAKTLWDPETDFWATVDDFLDGYYGKAGRPLRKFLDMLMAGVRGKDVHLGIYTGPESPIYAGDFLPEANKLFDDAEAAVAREPEALERVRHARLSIKYVDIVYKYWWKAKADVNEAEVRAFCDECRARGITNISEGRTVDSYFKAMMKE